MVKITELILAGTVAAAVFMLGHPLWLSTVDYAAWLDWVYWGLGWAFLAIAAGLYVIKRYRFVQYFTGLAGFLLVVLWFFQCFPNFSVSLL